MRRDTRRRQEQVVRHPSDVWLAVESGENASLRGSPIRGAKKTMTEERRHQPDYQLLPQSPTHAELLEWTSSLY